MYVNAGEAKETEKEMNLCLIMLSFRVQNG